MSTHTQLTEEDVAKHLHVHNKNIWLEMTINGRRLTRSMRTSDMVLAKERALSLLGVHVPKQTEGLKLSELRSAIRQQNLATKSLAYAAAMDQALAKLIDVIGDRYVEEVDREAVEIFQITLSQGAPRQLEPIKKGRRRELSIRTCGDYVPHSTRR